MGPSRVEASMPKVAEMSGQGLRGVARRNK